MKMFTFFALCMSAAVAAFLGHAPAIGIGLFALGALSEVASGAEQAQWDKDFFKEYPRASRFFSATGTDENKVIQVIEDLETKQGKSVTLTIVNTATGDGVTGDQTLLGNEEALDTHTFSITVDVLRNAFKVTKRGIQYAAIDMLKAIKMAAKIWGANSLRNRIIQAMASIDGVNFLDATTAQKNTWTTNNADRVVFGATGSAVPAVFLTETGTIDNTNDKMTAAIVSRAKGLAMSASPAITPIKVMSEEGEEWFIVYMNQRAFRDFKNDPVVVAANQYAMERGKKNPLFTGGDLIWDGCICKEIVEIGSSRTNVGIGYPLIGASSIPVGVSFLCGAQAVAIAYAERPRSIIEDNVGGDYQHVKGVAISMMWGVEKVRYGTTVGADLTTPKDHGMVTIWTAAVA